MANYYRGFNSGEIRDTLAMETWMRNRSHYPAYTALDCGDSVIKKTGLFQYFFNLINHDGVLLWTSVKGYESGEEAKCEFEVQHLYFRF